MTRPADRAPPAQSDAQAIPFTQYKRPDGRAMPVTINRPAEIAGMARAFIERGGWFECEVLTTGEVSLTACREDGFDTEDIAIRVVPNGPAVPDAVDALVREAAAAKP